MSSMPMASPALTALMSAAMMVAMMLPSVAPAVLRYQRDLLALRVSRPGWRTTLFAGGYAGVWAAVGLAMWTLSARLSPMPMEGSPFPPWVVASVVLCAGVVQRSQWKLARLRRCGQARVATSHGAMIDWGRGCRLGIDCCSSCAPAMAVLFVVGGMDARMMVVLTIVIATERLSSSGERVARLSGVAAIVAGVGLCAVAIGGL